MDLTDTLGIIAGSRSLPLILAREARRLGARRVVVAAFRGETDPAIAEWADEVEWLRVGQLQRMIDLFRRLEVKRCVMAGQIAPDNLFRLRPDARALKLLWSLKERNAHTLFRAIGDALAEEGISLANPAPWLSPLLPGAGYRLGPPMSEAQREDAAFGRRVASEVARLEIGQLVVVKEGTVMAVEGFEGTDACLERGGRLAGKKGGAVAVKIPKRDHDARFDIPCVGPRTIEICGLAKIAVLAFESDRTFLIDRKSVEAEAKKRKVILETFASEGPLNAAAEALSSRK